MKALHDRLAVWLVLAMLWMPVLCNAGSRIVIDAAHGGSDPGSKAGAEVEKDWNLKFAKAIAKAVSATGYEVVMIRGKDETIDPKSRIERINTSDATLVLVIHADRDFSSTRSGSMIVVQPPMNAPDPADLLPWGWIPSGRYRTNVRFAKILARELGMNSAFSILSDKAGFRNETVSWEGRILCAPHVHLRYLVPTAVVLTPLFLTSKTDIQKYSSDSAVAEFAMKIAAAVQGYFHAGVEENP